MRCHNLLKAIIFKCLHMHQVVVYVLHSILYPILPLWNRELSTFPNPPQTTNHNTIFSLCSSNFSHNTKFKYTLCSIALNLYMLHICYYIHIHWRTLHDGARCHDLPCSSTHITLTPPTFHFVINAIQMHLSRTIYK